MKTLFVLVAVVVILRLVKPLLVLHNMLRWRFWKTRTRLVAEDLIPPHVREGLRAPIAELQALGFEHIGWVALEADPPVLRRLQARLFHSVSGAYASVSFAATPDAVAPWVVNFTSVGEDGRVTCTYGGERPILGEPPGTVVVAPYALSTALQWEAHCNAVRAAGLPPSKLGHDETFALLRDQSFAHFDSLVRGGVLLPGAESAYVCSWSAALRATRAILAAMPRLKAQRALRVRALRTSLKPPVAVPVEEEVAAYERHRLSSSGPPRASFLLGLFAVTLPLFVLAGWFWMGAGTTAALALGIVLFHELGHYLAMRALGYVDTTIFFVPFLGGIAAGRNEHASVSQRMIVLLAGPLPGLVIAAAMSFVPHVSGPILAQALMLLAAINLFNLLPILPLDGGQMAHLLLFARRPWLDVSFRALAAVGLIALAVGLSATFLGVLGVLALLQLPKSWQQSNLYRQFGEARLAWPDEPPVHLFFRVLQTTPLASAPFGNKVVLARMTLEQAKMNAPLRPAARFGWLSAYAGAFAMGCAAVVLTLGVSGRAEAETGERASAESAPFACPESATLEQGVSGTAGPVRFEGLGVFDEMHALGAATARVTASAPGAVFRAFGSALLVWTVPVNDADDDERTFARTDTVASALRAGGGRFYDAVSAGPAIECTAPNDAVAERLGGGVEDYLAALRRSMAIPAPWVEEPTEAQRLARRTFRAAVTAGDTTPLGSPSRSLLSSLLHASSTTESVRDFRAKRLSAVETALAAQRATGSIDEDVARLIVARTSSSSPTESLRLDQELGTRLGADANRFRRATHPRLKASHAGARVRVELIYPQPSDVDSDVVPLLSWLCAESCTDLRVVVRGQSTD